MKKPIIFVLLALLLSVCVFTSCDSLWNVGETTNISFNLNLEKYFKQDVNKDVRSVGVVPGGNVFDYPDAYVLVSLHNSNDDSIIASQRLSLQEAQNTNVVFDEIRSRTQLYAKIEVNNPNNASDELPFIFRARTLDTVVKGNTLNLLAKPNAVFYEENGVSYVNGDSSYPIAGPNYDEDDSSFPSKIKRPNEQVLRDIYEFMKVDGTLLPDATVYIRNTMDVSKGNEIWDFKGLTIMRSRSYEALVSVTNDATLTLNNITIDGNRDIIVADTALVTVASSAWLTMNNGASIKNNYTPYEAPSSNLGGGVYLADGTTLIMNGGTISNNHCWRGGGGIYVSDGAEIMIGGNVTVKGNSKETIPAPSNIYLAGTAPTPIKIRQTLSGGEGSIGVSVQEGVPVSGYVTIAEGDNYPETFNDSKRFFSDNDAYQITYHEEPLGDPGINLYNHLNANPDG